ncbi:MAG: glutamate-5-semialdehyde dehydrogenase, partial [Actinomycetia bacterium]|nr:glutamate-5-semialdehyde dehydrogenase [Actinomycetes bacterium]
MNDINVARQALLARDASKVLGSADLETRNKALHAMADALIDNETVILEANQLDIADARENGIRENIIDRLMLDHERLAACGDALRELADLDEVLGEVIDEREIAEGIQMQQVRVPLGVVGMIYEARPNVTCDAAGIGVKTGNAMLLRGGSLARQTNAVLVDVLAEALKAQGLPSASIQAVDARDRASASDMMGMRGMIDLLIPRGGPGLITSVVENSKVPVIETGTGNCHIYIEKSADIDMARDIVVNAKCQRPSVCNAAESLLIDASIVDEVFAEVLPALTDRGVTLVVDPDYVDKARFHSSDSALIRAATEEDYGTEYLDLIISVKVVEGVEQAVE